MKEALKLALEALEESWHLTPKPDYVRAAITTIKAALAQAAQRTWVGLTDREKSNLWLESRAAIPRFNTYATLVEAKLKEKNNGLL